MSEIVHVLLITSDASNVAEVADIMNKSGLNVYIHRVNSINDIAVSSKLYTWACVLLYLDTADCGLLKFVSPVKECFYKIPIAVIHDNINKNDIITLHSAGLNTIMSRDSLIAMLRITGKAILDSDYSFRDRSIRLESFRSEEKYRQLTESISDMVFSLDVNLCCTYWNRTAEKLTGISMKSALTRPFVKLFPDHPGKEIESSLIEVLKNNEPSVMMFSWDIQGETRQFEMNMYPYQSGLTVLTHDITFRNKSEMPPKTPDEVTFQLAQAQELRILGQLTSGVAHEVRNPLNAISVVLEALFQDIGEVAEYRMYKEHLFTHVDRLKRLMQDLLELGRPIERSKVTTFDIEDLIRETVDIWKTSGADHQFAIDIKLTGETDLRVKGDPLKLQQVFMNIFENAYQHSTLEKVLNISIAGFDDYCEIKIADRGNGIKPELLTKIFDPFFTTRKKGTGLGLSIVKHIVEVHGGTIGIQNNATTPGCTVIVVLPRVQKFSNRLQKDTTEIERGCISSFRM